MSNFVPLHIVSGYSFLQSGLTMKKILKGINNNSYFGAGLTDLGVLHGFPEFASMMEENKKPYILGMDVVINEYNVSIFITSEQGYINLIKINELYQKDELSLENITSLNEGLIGVIETNHGRFKELFSSLEEINATFTKELYKVSSIFKTVYLGIEVTSKEEVKYSNKIRKFADEYTYKTVAFPRIKYLSKEDAIVLEIVEAIKSDSTLSEKKKDGQEYFMKVEDYQKIYSLSEINASKEILESSNFVFRQKRGEMLKFTNENSSLLLKTMCEKSLKDKGLDTNETYVNQLNHELDVINEMGYADYFLLVQDYVVWAKTHNVLVGPGRGSAAGSLVSYLLNISEADPIKYDLQFERFLNTSRKSMPDIDVDFMDTRRDVVVNYMKEKYGIDRVSNIVAFQTIQAKQALRDIGRVYKYPESHISLLSKSLVNPKYSLGQSYKNIPEFKKLVDSDQYFKTFVSLAGKIEGLPRQAGQHAAGIVLNNTPISNSLPCTFDFSDNLISQYEAKYLEEQNYLKMDFLGLRNLTVVDYCVNLINHNHPEAKIDKNNIPFDTPEVFELIRKGKVIGLFQIETSTMRNGIKTIKPTCFKDVVALLALNRPGPMQFVRNYALRRDGKEKFSYISEELKPILEDTYGIIIYQEQINKIAMVMAGFSAGEADTFRRAISKKKKDMLSSLKKDFINGAIKNGYKEATAVKVFEHIYKFADYGFNKSHSVVYAMLTCRMAYLKAHYPLEFYNALLDIGTSSETKFTEYVSEMKTMGINVLQPSVNKSERYFSIDENGIRFPLNSIKGLTEVSITNILQERKKNGLFIDFVDFVTRMFGYKLNNSMINRLIDSGALDEFSSSRESLRLSILPFSQYAELNYSKDGQLTIGISPIAKPNLVPAKDDPIENLNKEYESIGIMLSSNPLSFKNNVIKEKGCISIVEAKESEGIVKVAGIVKTRKIISTKKGQYMAFVKIFDQSDEIELTLFPELFESKKPLTEKNMMIIVTGRSEGEGESFRFVTNDIEPLEE